MKKTKIIKLNKKIVFYFLFLVFLIIYIIYRAPKDVPLIYSNMTGLIVPMEKINGNILSEIKMVKSGAALVLLEFSSSRWNKITEEENSKLLENLGAIRIKEGDRIRYCRGREQYDIVPPSNYGNARYSIAMSYPGTDC